MELRSADGDGREIFLLLEHAKPRLRNGVREDFTAIHNLSGSLHALHNSSGSLHILHNSSGSLHEKQALAREISLQGPSPQGMGHCLRGLVANCPVWSGEGAAGSCARELLVILEVGAGCAFG